MKKKDKCEGCGKKIKPGLVYCRKCRKKWEKENKLLGKTF